jgi:Fe-S oxidoreductase
MRVDFPLEHPDFPDGENARPENGTYREFMLEAGDLVVKYGGSMSGEHGDGRCRSELLSKMYSPEAIELLRKFKALFDPNNILNPGIVVDPLPMEEYLRRPLPKPLSSRDVSRNSDGRAKRGGHLTGIAAKAGYNGFAFSDDDHDLTKAAHRCMGVGKCRAGMGGAAKSFMCPSYQATQDEKDVTRGRARVIQEAINGSLVHGLTAPEVMESLELCLGCKACGSDCPAVVDVARWKSEILHRAYRNRRRPLDHYSLGRLPEWLRVASANRALRAGFNLAVTLPGFKAIASLLAGIAPQRSIPKIAGTSFHQWWAARETGGDGNSSKPPVVLWTDPFTEYLDTTVALAAVKVLDAAGYKVIVPNDVVDSGLTLIATGQLDLARTKLDSLLNVLGPFAVNGVPILGLEPSCVAVLRSDLLDLFPDDPRAKAVSQATYTLAELLTDPATAPRDWQVPDLHDVKAVVQPHCHHHAVMGYGTDEKLLRDAGAKITVLSGCCGMAGNFGMKKNTYDVSVKIAEQSLLPALRSAAESSEFLADGISCRTQASDLGGVQGKALAQILADRL